MDRKLEKLLGDTPETEVCKSSVQATVIKKKDNNSFIIRDETKEAELEIDEKFKNKIQVGYKFVFYSPEKTSMGKLRLTKGSHAKKLHLDESLPTTTIKMKDLVGKPDKTSVEETLVVRVLDEYEP